MYKQAMQSTSKCTTHSPKRCSKPQAPEKLFGKITTYNWQIVTKIGNGREVEEEMFYSYWQKKYLSRYEGTMQKRIIPERPKDLSKNRLVHDPTPSLLITILR